MKERRKEKGREKGREEERYGNYFCKDGYGFVWNNMN